MLDGGHKVFVLVGDNLRFDQWRTLSRFLSSTFGLNSDELYMSITPYCNHAYARNAMFAGMLPAEIEKTFPELWDDDDNEGNKNQHEEELLIRQLKRHRRQEKRLYFEKVTGIRRERQLSEVTSIQESDLSVMVFNFVDMISHARTEMNMIRELANDEKAYRSLTLSWFNHSPVLELIRNLAGNNIKLVVNYRPRLH